MINDLAIEQIVKAAGDSLCIKCGREVRPNDGARYIPVGLGLQQVVHKGCLNMLVAQANKQHDPAPANALVPLQKSGIIEHVEQLADDDLDMYVAAYTALKRQVEEVLGIESEE